MPETRWWDDREEEVYWLEITDRDDLGVDLNAPAARETGGTYWSYDFVREVRDGDVVFHYCARPKGAITHWSRAVGDAYPDEVTWGAHGQASGRGPVQPYPRPGWRHPLDGPYELEEPLTKQELRAREPAIRAAFDALQAEHPGASLYFPFQFSDSRPLRAFQGYLTKLPRSLVESLPHLREVEHLALHSSPSAESPAPTVTQPGLGAEYRRANPNVRTARREPFSVDPDLVDRALRAHAETQDRLSDAVREAGLVPRSPVPGEPVFDLAWEDGDALVVAEVKSLTSRNEERQLRLALGQVLRYADLLGRKGRPVRAVIAAEREPADRSWVPLCANAGVTLVWPETFATLLFRIT